ncbi:DUF5384 family protein [Pseudomonas sp. TE3610]
MARLIIVAALAALAAEAQAGPFDQLHQIEVQQQQVQAAEQAKATAREEAEQRARRASQARAAEQAAAKRKVLAREQARQRARTEQHQDEEHALDIEERKLRLQTMKAKADRANEYVDAELRGKAAQTDVVQSQADAMRNLSSGTKTLLEDAGKAEVNRSKKLFGN